MSSCGQSPSGEYIVVVYSTFSKNAGFMDGHNLTLIWKVNAEVRFKRRMRNEPWAKIIFSHECEVEGFQTTGTSVVFLDGGYCLTPSGEIHLASGCRRPLLDRFVPNKMDVLGSFFSQNGKYLFISEMVPGSTCRAKRVALFIGASEYLCSWKDSSRRLADVSPSGRFLVLSNAEIGVADEALYLYDVETSKNIRLPFVERLIYWEAKYQFMKDEMELIVFISCQIYGIETMNVFVWSDLQSDPLLIRYGQLKLVDNLSPL